MKKLMKTENFILISASFILAIICNANSQEISQAERAKSDSLRRQLLDEDWFYREWTSEALTGDNKPFHDIRMEIRRLGKQKQLQSVLPRYARAAQLNPYDPKVQYRWVMAAWALFDSKAENQPGKRVESSLWKWRNALSFAVQPKAYDYTRLRFLITTENAMKMGKYASDQRLKHLGERLLKIQPEDEFVSYWLRQLRSHGSSLEDKMENLRDAQRLVKAKPKNTNAQGQLAGAYLSLWMVTKRRSHANIAVAQYQKWLQMAPRKDPFRWNAAHWIEAIPTGQKLWEKQGTGRAD